MARPASLAGWAAVRPVLLVVGAAALGAAQTAPSAPLSPTNIFSPESVPARSILHLSAFVLEITGAIFVVVFTLLAYAVIKFRQRKDDDGSEPAQVFGSQHLELAWTVLPVLIVFVLFLSTAQVIHRVQDAPPPTNAVQVAVTGHQFWWQFQYPQFNFSTANELHVPVQRATYLHLDAADVDHSFWVPRLAGKTDLIPNHPNLTWIQPDHPGVYLGQCAQFCGAAHADMLLRVYVQTPADFQRWVTAQQQPAMTEPAVALGQALFVAKACFACHTVRGTIAAGVAGPDLTHLMSRDTIASGLLPNDAAHLSEWIRDPSALKPGVSMPAVEMTAQERRQIVAYLLSLH